jgi:hypothetical protein
MTCVAVGSYLQSTSVQEQLKYACEPYGALHWLSVRSRDGVYWWKLNTSVVGGV